MLPKFMGQEQFIQLIEQYKKGSCAMKRLIDIKQQELLEQCDEAGEQKENIIDTKETVSETIENIRQIQKNLQTLAEIKLKKFDNFFNNEHQEIDEIEQNLLQTQEPMNQLKQQSHQLKQLQQQYQSVQMQKRVKQLEIDQVKQKNYQLEKNIDELKKNIDNIGQQINETPNYLEQLNTLKRQINNEIQSAKGTVRVYCRIRPGEQEMLQVDGCKIQLQVPEKVMKTTNQNKSFEFQFESVFDQQSTQVDVYKEIQPVVSSIIDGNNVCIMAYGQTGTGKTYSMIGNQEDQGIIPRAIRQVFDECKELIDKGYNVSYQVGFSEVYCEQIYDLYDYKKVDDLKVYDVENQIDLQRYFEIASANRKTAETSGNYSSSRSHFIFEFQITKQITYKGQYLKDQNSLAFIDLAGSEKIEKGREAETKFINKSLSTLSQVFIAIQQQQAHIPYRNSKLTTLLQRFLEGQSKTVMIVNISPNQDDYPTTIFSLKFADNVKNIKIRNIDQDPDNAESLEQYQQSFAEYQDDDNLVDVEENQCLEERPSSKLKNPVQVTPIFFKSQFQQKLQMGDPQSQTNRLQIQQQIEKPRNLTPNPVVQVPQQQANRAISQLKSKPQFLLPSTTVTLNNTTNANQRQPQNQGQQARQQTYNPFQIKPNDRMFFQQKQKK
ncbi:hypothetical protein pb186bvf_000412 [Paramecium bursaria]